MAVTSPRNAIKYVKSLPEVQWPCRGYYFLEAKKFYKMQNWYCRSTRMPRAVKTAVTYLEVYSRKYHQWINVWGTLVVSSQSSLILLNTQFETDPLPTIYVTVLGYPPLSRPVARRRSSSPTGLGYRCYASTYPLKRIANGGPKGSHLNPPSNGALVPAQAPRMHAPPKWCTPHLGAHFWLAIGWVTSKTATLVYYCHYCHIGHTSLLFLSAKHVDT